MKKIFQIILAFGVNPKVMFYSFLSLPRYMINLVRFFYESRKHNDFKMALYPQLTDRHVGSLVAKGHYFHQDLWAARRIYKRKPKNHIDVGSRIDGFIAHLLTFMEVTVIDIRLLNSAVTGLHFFQHDIMSEHSYKDEGFRSSSVSCLHALEHFGLGRYGDPIDWDGWKRALGNISRIIEHGGIFYLSVPIGKQRIEFDAHRVFNPRSIIEIAEANGIQLNEFSYVDDFGDFHYRVNLDAAENCNYGCGCFEFVKINNN